jgi:hypothetical protein
VEGQNKFARLPKHTFKNQMPVARRFCLGELPVLHYVKDPCASQLKQISASFFPLFDPATGIHYFSPYEM